MCQKLYDAARSCTILPERVRIFQEAERQVKELCQCGPIKTSKNKK
jgi:hypothetical protein